MSYGKICTSTQVDKNLLKTYTVNIYQNGVGNSSPMPTVEGAAQMITLEWGQTGDDPHRPVVSSRATIKLYDKYDWLFRTLAPATDKQFRIEILQDGSDYWDGFMVADAIERSTDYLGSKVITIQATDALSYLKNIPYVQPDGSPYTGREKIITIILRCLAKAGLTDHYLYTLLKWYPHLDSNPLTSEHDTLERLKIDQDWLYDDEDNAYSCFTLLEQFAGRFLSRIFLFKDYWFFLQRQQSVAFWPQTGFRYDPAGVQDTVTFLAESLPAGAGRTGGGREAKLPSWGQAETTYLHGQLESLIENANFEAWDVSNSLPDNWEVVSAVSSADIESTYNIGDTVPGKSLHIGGVYYSAYVGTHPDNYADGHVINTVGQTIDGGAGRYMVWSGKAQILPNHLQLDTTISLPVRIEFYVDDGAGNTFHVNESNSWSLNSATVINLGNRLAYPGEYVGYSVPMEMISGATSVTGEAKIKLYRLEDNVTLTTTAPCLGVTFDDFDVAYQDNSANDVEPYDTGVTLSVDSTDNTTFGETLSYIFGDGPTIAHTGRFSILDSTDTEIDDAVTGGWRTDAYAITNFGTSGVSPAADTISIYTSSVNPFADDDLVIVTSTNTVPAGITSGTSYYVVNSAASTVQLSSSEGGAAIDITDKGAGTHSIGDKDTNKTIDRVHVEERLLERFVPIKRRYEAWKDWIRSPYSPWTESYATTVTSVAAGAVTVIEVDDPIEVGTEITVDLDPTGTDTGVVTIVKSNDDGTYDITIDAAITNVLDGGDVTWSEIYSWTYLKLMPIEVETEGEWVQYLRDIDNLDSATATTGYNRTQALPTVSRPISISYSVDGMQTVETYADLESTEPAQRLTYASRRRASGFTLPGGAWVFDPASTDDHDDGVVLRPASVATSSGGRWLRMDQAGPVQTEWYASKRDGSTNDAAAVQAAIDRAAVLGRHVMLSDGVHAIDTNLTFTSGCKGIIGPGSLKALSGVVKVIDLGTGGHSNLFFSCDIDLNNIGRYAWHGEQVTNSTWDGCRITNGSIGGTLCIALSDGSSYNNFRNCYFEMDTDLSVVECIGINLYQYDDIGTGGLRTTQGKATFGYYEFLPYDTITAAVSGTNLTTNEAFVVAGDVGKLVAIVGAGSAPSNVHVTTIASFSSSTAVVLTDSAPVAVNPITALYLNVGAEVHPISSVKFNNIEGCHFVGGSHQIAMAGVTRCSVTNCDFDHPTARGVYIGPGASWCTIIGNRIRNTFSTGIHAAYWCHHNNIANNVIDSNTLSGGDQAGVQLYLGCHHNTVTNNVIISNRYSGLTGTFTADTGADTITVTGDDLEVDQYILLSTTGTLPAPLAATSYYIVTKDGNDYQLAATKRGSIINITTTGSGTHTATDNSDPLYYGVYLAVNSQHNRVTGNKIYGAKVGVGLDSDWEDTLPALAYYARPGSLDAVHATDDSYLNEITNNYIEPLLCGISLEQVNNKAGQHYELYGNVIKDNYVSNAASYLVYFYEEQTAHLYDNFLGAVYSDSDVAQDKVRKNNAAIGLDPVTFREIRDVPDVTDYRRESAVWRDPRAAPYGAGIYLSDGFSAGGWARGFTLFQDQSGTDFTHITLGAVGAGNSFSYGYIAGALSGAYTPSVDTEMWLKFTISAGKHLVTVTDGNLRINSGFDLDLLGPDIITINGQQVVKGRLAAISKLTNSTGGSADGTLSAVTTTISPSIINDNFTELNAKVDLVIDRLGITSGHGLTSD